MLIISVRGNGNNRWKKCKKKNKKQKTKSKDIKEQRRTDAIVKGWELNDFVVTWMHNKII